MASVVSASQIPIHGKTTGLQPGDFRDVMYWLVVLSEPDADGRSLALGSAAQALGVPADGAGLAGTGRVAVRRRADPEPGMDDGAHWRVEVEYGTDPATFGGPGTGEPWDAEVRLSFASVIYERALERDFSAATAGGQPNGDPVVNAAGDPFEPPIMFRVYNDLVRVAWSRRQSEFDPFDARRLRGSLNQAGFSLRGEAVPAEKALLLDVNAADAVWSDGTKYYNITAEIEIEGEMALKSPPRLNRGFRELRTLNTVAQRVFCTDPVPDPADPTIAWLVDGVPQRVPVNSPVLLKTSDGTRYTGASPHTDCVATFVEHRTASWTNLKLP